MIFSRPTRRHLMKTSGALAALSMLGMGSRPAHSDRDSIAEVKARLSSGRVTATDIAEDLIARVKNGTQLNGMATFDESVVLARAAVLDAQKIKGAPVGSLHGVPVVLKDNINTVSWPTSGGTPALKDNVPPKNAPLVDRLISAGALIAGKANLHELSTGGTTDNGIFGPARNPYDVTRVPGGSSGGVAVAVAARFVPAGIGTDTAGSVRVPASLCGLFGFRPTTGRYPGEGIVPLSSTMDTAGPMAHSVDDIILLDSVMSGDESPVAERPLTQLRLGVARNLFEAASDEVKAVCEKAISALTEAGVLVKETDMTSLMSLHAAATNKVMAAEMTPTLRTYLKQSAPGVSLEMVADQAALPMVKGMIKSRLRNPVSNTEYQKTIQEIRPTLKTRWQSFLEEQGVDAVIFPTTPDVALPLDKGDNVFKNGRSVFSWFYFGNTTLASAGDRPSLTTPIGLSSEGLPVGLCFDGLPGKDKDLLALVKSVAPLLPATPAP